MTRATQPLEDGSQQTNQWWRSECKDDVRLLPNTTDSGSCEEACIRENAGRVSPGEPNVTQSYNLHARRAGWVDSTVVGRTTQHGYFVELGVNQTDEISQ